MTAGGHKDESGGTEAKKNLAEGHHGETFAGNLQVNRWENKKEEMSSYARKLRLVKVDEIWQIGCRQKTSLLDSLRAKSIMSKIWKLCFFF